jgi:hypothetical protein
MDDLYDIDTLLWSERQAGLLRRPARGEHVNDQVDRENIIEEIECVGRESRPRSDIGIQHELYLLRWPAANVARHSSGRGARGLPREHAQQD